MKKRLLKNAMLRKRIWLRKMFLRMNYLFCLLVLGALSVSAEVYSQNGLVSLKMKDVSLVKVFNEITKQTGYDFLYNYDLVQNKGTVYGCGKMGVISLRGAVFFIYLGILFVIALVDWHIQMIYDRFHIMILILAVLDFMLYPEMGIATRLTGMGIISVPMLVLALAIPGAFGGGDIKLMSVSGLLIGGASMICAMCIGIITGGAYVTLMLVRKRLNKTDQFAFGPFLAFGLATAIFLGDKMAVWYLQFGTV